MGALLRKSLIAVCVALAATSTAPGPVRAQVPPHARWQTLATEHFRVTYSPGLEAMARHVAERAEIARARLAEELGSPPRGVVDILISDHVDDSNGFARPFPTNRITLYARPPVDHLALSFAPDWIDLLVVHELAHIIHMDRAGKLGSVLRGVFGRAPIIWPVFPAVATPQWSIEGLATYFESRITGAGRAFGSFHEMVVRTDVLEDRFVEIDKAAGYSPEWPGGMRWYAYGSLFYDYVARTRGVDALRELATRTANAWVPPVLAFDRVARRGLGVSFTDLWAAWREQLRHRYAALADSLRAQGLTEGEALTTEGRNVLYPRVAAGGRVAYAVEDGRTDPATRVLDLSTGERRSLGRRNGLATLAWFPGGDSLLVAQREFSGRYHVFGDFYVVDARGKERRITRGARLTEPDVAPDGTRAVAVQTEAGATRVVLVDLGNGSVEPITEYDLAVNWSAPRWSPSGDYIAVARWRLGGEYDVVVLDPDGRLVHELTRDRAIDAAPAWSPDGRYVLFWSDRSGIPNLYAYDFTAQAASAGEEDRLLQVTNTLTGAFYPDIDPEARWIYYIGYRSDGYRIERIPYEPGRWRPAPPIRPELAADAGQTSAAPTERRAALPVDSSKTPSAGSKPYSAARTLLPHYWLPTLTDAGVAGRFIGAATFGEDLVGRHSFNAWAAVDPDASRFAGALNYRYAGLGNPVLDFGLARDWDRAGRVRLDDGSTRDVVERESVFGVAASFARRRWRSFAAFDLGVEDVRRQREILDGAGLRLADPEDALSGIFARASYGTARARTLSISREAGFTASVAARHRWDRDPAPSADRSYSEATALFTAFQPVPAFGFANHVLALRASALWRGGPGAGISDIGGASGTPIDLGVATVGAARFLPVRGFDLGARSGSRAWTASLEYRLPIALVGRGYRNWPFNIDRLAAALFLDAGNAWCSPEIQQRSALCTAPDGSGRAGPLDPAPLIGAGAELALDLSLLFSAPTRVRAGVGFPIQGPANAPAFYLQFGPGF